MLLLIWVSSAVPALSETYCSAPPYSPGERPEEQELAELSEAIRAILAGFPTLGEAFETGAPALCLSSRMDGALAYLDVERNRIVLRDDLPDALKIAVLLHELRHLWQVREGVCPNDALSMKEYTRATFAMEADASAVSLLIAWELKQNGDAQIWEALSAWPSQSDIAASFAQAMSETGDKRHAASAAFRQWYISHDRVQTYYLSSCSGYLDRQDDSHALPQYRSVPQD